MKINLLFIVLLVVGGNLFAQSSWKLNANKIVSKWAKEVTPDNVLQEYPRPQLVREQWLNLNGLWDYAIVNNELESPVDYQGQILVPFAVESALSGVTKR